ncbi:hypothetical protein ACLB2K_031280 [Fragaria x ananassa]
MEKKMRELGAKVRGGGGLSTEREARAPFSWQTYGSEDEPIRQTSLNLGICFRLFTFGIDGDGGAESVEANQTLDLVGLHRVCECSRDRQRRLVGSTSEWHGDKVLVSISTSGGWLRRCARVVALLVSGDGDVDGRVMAARATVPLGIGLE